MKHIKIIGTSHIARQSVNEIKKAIAEWKPEIIALELDIQRASALMQEKKNKISLKALTKIGLKGYLFARIGQFVQQKLGRKVGMAPGSEMKTALEAAHKEKIQVAFIDQPIKVTLNNFSKSLGWKEKWHFAVDMLKGLITPRKQMKEIGLENFDLRKVPDKETIKLMISNIKKRYPSIYKSLVEDRNVYMVQKLVKLMKENKEKKILVVVGAGHKEGMEELLLKVDVIK